jgi:hypothetical protein
LISSSNGPLQPTSKIAYQDIKVGIPDTMLCIEMAIFAVMHIFAFPWSPYSAKQNSDPLNVQGAGFSGEVPKYKGGPFGIKALVDAFNPWDLVKASARGFRWLFVGVRHRKEDISYQNPAKLGEENTGYLGPTYGGSGEAATELRPSDDAGHGRRRGDTVEDDDRAGLLQHSQSNPARMPSASPYRTYSNEEYGPGDDSHMDISAMSGNRLQAAVSPPDRHRVPNYSMPHAAGGYTSDVAKSSDYGPADYGTEEEPEEIDEGGYHPGYAHAGVHPALRNEGAGQWDHWAGAARPQQDSHDLPPGYRMDDLPPHR